MFQLPILAGTAPVGLRRIAAILALVRKAVRHCWHILHDNDTTQKEVPPCRLKSRQPYYRGSEDAECHVTSQRTGHMMHVLRQPGSRSGKHPDPLENILTYQIQLKGSGRDALGRQKWTPHQTTNWCRSLVIIHEDERTGGQGSM